MGLKPLLPLYFLNRQCKNSNSAMLWFYCPRLLRGRLSALADGFCKLLLNWALATFQFILIKRLIQKFIIRKMDFNIVG